MFLDEVDNRRCQADIVVAMMDGDEEVGSQCQGKEQICRHEKVAQDGICDVISRIADQIVIMRSLNVHQNIGNYIKG